MTTAKKRTYITNKQKQELKELFEKEIYTDKQVAELTGINVKVVYYQKRIMGYTNHHKPSSKWNDAALKEARKIWRETHSIQALEQRFGVKESTIRTHFCILRKKGIDAPYLYKPSRKC